jgi:hypothetical protein
METTDADKANTIGGRLSSEGQIVLNCSNGWRQPLQ